MRVLGGGWPLLGLRRRAEQVKTKRQQRGASPVGQEAEVPNADQAFGKHVQQEAAQEFIQGKGQQLLFVAVSGVGRGSEKFGRCHPRRLGQRPLSFWRLSFLDPR